MIRHPRYLEIPWDVHWHQGESGPHGHLWQLIVVLTLVAMFLIGVGVTSGIM
ncbi:MAG: hypothetical protein ACT4O4_06375 [Nitrospiraceae bacterium]